MIQYKRIDISKGIDFNKTSKSLECIFAIIGILKTLGLNISHMFVMDVIIFQWLFKI